MSAQDALAQAAAARPPLARPHSASPSAAAPAPHPGRAAKPPVPVHHQLQQLRLDHASSSSLHSVSSAPGMLEDDAAGDIALSIPRSRSDHALAGNLQRSLARPASCTSAADVQRAGSQTPLRASALPCAAQAASAPVSPQRDAGGQHHRLSPAAWREDSTAAAAADSAARHGPPGSPPPPSHPREPPSTPPRIVTSEHTSPINYRCRRQHSGSLTVQVPGSPAPAPLLGRSASGTGARDRGDRGDLSLDADTDASGASPRPPPLVDDDTARQMSRWVKEVVVCNFDLERGPVVERRAIGRRWGPGLKENVAFSSFPDTSLFTEGSIQFSFKIRDVPPSQASLAFPEPPSPRPDRNAGPVLGHSRGTSLSREKEAEYRSWDERGREWLYGYVWFQQKKDRGIARGFMQKSVVILTHLPLPALFSAMLSRIAPAFFQHGYTAVEVACHNIASWPDPAPDALLELPLLTDILNVKMPDKTENPQVAAPCRGGPHPILASQPASTPLRAFSSFLPSLWSIWECLILAEPLLVIAPDPKTCSEVVWWLRELVRPLPLAGDFRPYLHIHDHDFSLLVNANKPQAGVVVGVTNPFFRNAASHWPNVISIPGAAKAKGPGGPKQEGPEGFLSRRVRSVSKDRALLKRLEQLVAAGRLDDVDGNIALRTHFQQLTERMLVPLNRYFQTLVPPRMPHPTPPGSEPSTPPLQIHQPRPQHRLSPYSPMENPLGTRSPGTLGPGSPALSSLKPFSLPAFLQHLKTHGPNPLAFKTRGISGKSRVESGFYSAFCKSSTFAGWLAARIESLGIAVASNMVQDAVSAAAALRDSPDLFVSAYRGDRASDRSSTEASYTTASTAPSLATTSDHDDEDAEEGTGDGEADEAATPKPTRDDDPFAHHRCFAREVFAGKGGEHVATPTRTRPMPRDTPRNGLPHT